MNSEELELSLRTEFENYLKSVVADMRRDVDDFQSKINGEVEKHRSQIDEAFQGFAGRFDSSHAFDQGFTELVVEHLRLARDEGAKLSANAFAAGEKLDAQTAAPTNFGEVRDAVNDISSHDSQSSILKSLVENAAKFAPRGAFFIIKNEHFAGWKVFGDEADSAEGAIRDIHFPVAADSILAKAVASRSTAESAYGGQSEDTDFLNPLQFGQPDRMYAIPLVARGRGVAVLYVDYGTEGVSVNLEALETIVRTAALTVELLASTHTAKTENRQMADADFEQAHFDSEESEEFKEAATAPPVESHFEDAVEQMPVEPAVVENKTHFAIGESDAVHDVFSAEQTPAEPAAEHSLMESETHVEHPQMEETPIEKAEPTFDTPHVDHELVAEHAPAFEAEEVRGEPSAEAESTSDFKHRGGEMAFDSGGSIEPAAMEYAPFDPAVEPEPAVAIRGSMNQVTEPAIEISPASLPQARLSDRPVDLPIEVPEEERRLHNDARRFARLLVSEIKLYNEKKVLEGRQSHDLYDRLREAVDRSREMYDKRVQPPVAARFDYFHYELLNALAEGNAERLGTNYPGSTV